MGFDPFDSEDSSSSDEVFLGGSEEFSSPVDAFLVDSFNHNFKSSEFFGDFDIDNFLD